MAGLRPWAFLTGLLDASSLSGSHSSLELLSARSLDCRTTRNLKLSNDQSFRSTERRNALYLVGFSYFETSEISSADPFDGVFFWKEKKRKERRSKMLKLFRIELIHVKISIWNGTAKISPSVSPKSWIQIKKLVMISLDLWWKREVEYRHLRASDYRKKGTHWLTSDLD